jgi:hypothetical protein
VNGVEPARGAASPRDALEDDELTIRRPGRIGVRAPRGPTVGEATRSSSGGRDDPERLTSAPGVLAEGNPPVVGRPTEAIGLPTTATAACGEPPRTPSVRGGYVEGHSAARVQPVDTAAEKRESSAVPRPGRLDDSAARACGRAARDRAQPEAARVDDQQRAVSALDRDLPVAASEHIGRRRHPGHQQDKNCRGDRDPPPAETARAREAGIARRRHDLREQALGVERLDAGWVRRAQAFQRCLGGHRSSRPTRTSAGSPGAAARRLLSRRRAR